MKHRIFPLALKEYEENILYYLSLSEKSAEDFIAEIEQGIQLICSHPNAWPSVGKKARCFLCHRFPYGIYYRVTPEKIEIGSILHLKRKPGLWKERFQE